MNRIDLEVEYNNRARVPGHPAVIAGWARDAAAYRGEAADRMQVHSYGPTERQKLHVFHPKAPDPAALPVLFIHGGYWQALDPSFFSHMAKGLNEHGITVALAGYDLCPDVSVGAILEQNLAAARALYALTGKPFVASGHSVGGHMAACLAAVNWKTLDGALPARLVPAGMAISGLFELEPLVPTSINVKLGLDIAAARSFSPRLWEPPLGVTFEAWVGGEESAEYLRQSATIAAVWAANGNDTGWLALPGKDHFTVLDALPDPGSAMTLRLKTMAKRG
ncbi:MAG: alpha/beta fold hydrolase [Methylocystis sp.]|jgi:arylformamidase|nr:alpha/beta fold hydrolase [Methylocystis sp.]MCA3586145.1 alpha/beta fold hydrolase [Methylocystis sp.]MCA3589088.1 alpha/beta fold hydrolase [Methylocystis sp.]MCA3592881.1 alpha/beta fold hydrolase [Methylocystis sp.]